MEEKATKKSNNSMMMFGVLFVLALILIILGFMINYFVKNNNSVSSDNKKMVTPEELIESLKIEEYFGYIINEEVRTDVNLLDSSSEYLYLYAFTNDNMKKYKIHSGNTFNAGWTFIKYEDFAKEYERVYGEACSIYQLGQRTFSLNNITSVSNDEYAYSDMATCESNNLDNCYVIIVNDTAVSGTAIVSDLKMTDNVITGSVRKEFAGTDSIKGYSREGTFKLTLKNSGDNYYLDGLVMKSLDDIKYN